MTQQLIASDNGINWIWYYWFEIEDEIVDGKVKGRILNFNRFHRSDERQGANNHPVADCTLVHSASEPKGWQLTDSNPKFWLDGWLSNCKSQGLDPEKVSAFHILRRKNKQTLTVFLEKNANRS